MAPKKGDALLLAARAIEAGVAHGAAKALVGSYETLMRLEGYEMQGWSPILKRFLTGVNNLQKNAFKEADKAGRLPITASLLVSIRGALFSLQWSQYKKKAFWAVLAALFWGSLRANEILCQEATTFNISQSFLESDIRVDNRGIVLLWLRDKSRPSSRGCSGTSPLQDNSAGGSNRSDSRILAVQEQHIWIGHGCVASETFFRPGEQHDESRFYEGSEGGNSGSSRIHGEGRAALRRSLG